MTPEQWARVKVLLHSSRTLEPSAYRAAVEAAFPEAPEIWDEVLLVLQAATRDTVSSTRAGDPAPSDLPEPLETRAFAEGDVCGPYRVQRLIGIGGMGEVYLAEDSRTGLAGMPIRRVALKCLSGKWLRRPDARYRLLVEFAAAAALESHTHIAAAHDALELRGGQLMVLVMEFVDGTPLNQLIRKGPLPWRYAVELAAQVAEGLAQAHLRSILHCDIKPGNIMVTPRRQAKILDFGLSRAQHMPSEDDARIGTLAYMPPERLVDNVLDVSGDLYSLGAALHEMLTGHRAFPADNQFALMAQVLEVIPPPPSALATDVPGSVDAIVVRALAKDPAQRFQTAHELASALRAAIDQRRGVRGESLLRVAAGVMGFALITSFLGAISSRAVDLGLGRTGGFVGDVRHSSLVWGAMSLTAPLLLVAASGLFAGAVAVLLRLALRAVPPFRRAVVPALDGARRRLSTTFAASGETVGQFVLLAQGALLLSFAWYFWPLMQSVTHFGSADVPGTLDALRPSNQAMHENFRIYGTFMLVTLIASWWFVHSGRRSRGRLAPVSVGGLMAIAIGLCVLFYPVQVLFHNQNEIVVYKDANCYLVARNSNGQARLFCPRAPGPERLRTISLADPNLVLTGRVESVFAELDRNRANGTRGAEGGGSAVSKTP